MLRPAAALLVSLVAAGFGAPVAAQRAGTTRPPPADSAAMASVLLPDGVDWADSTGSAHPNATPLAPRPSPAAQVLGLPATVYRAVLTPIRAGVVRAEQSGLLDRVGAYVSGDDTPGPARRYSFRVSPLVSVGGREGIGLGLRVRQRGWLGPTRSVSLQGLYASSETYRVQLSIRDTSVARSGVAARLVAAHRADGFEDLYPLGNETDEDDRAAYALQRTAGSLALARRFGRRVRLDGRAELRRDDVRPYSDDDLPQIPSGLPGEDPNTMGVVEATGDFDLTRRARVGINAPRESSGPGLLARYTYGREVNGLPLEFHRALAEARAFVPVPFLHPDRRIGLRARLERAWAGGDREVPFYELPTLGGADVLRSFRANRFRDFGALVLSAEYRYALSETLDAVLFTDQGQVFDSFDELSADRFHGSYGGGLHVRNRSGTTSGRIEGATGAEGFRLILQVGAAF